MPTQKVNGVNIYYEIAGNIGAPPLVLVHGSWVDHHSWDMVSKYLAKDFYLLSYDRRGHSQSERVHGQGASTEDVDDLIALVEQLKLAPAHIVGNSFGASIVLKAAAKRPEIFQSMMVHEPPLFGLLGGIPRAEEILKSVDEKVKKVVNLILGDNKEKAAEIFVEEIALGPGSWPQLPDWLKKTFAFNAITWMDELQDPQSLQIDLLTLSAFTKPTLLSAGSESPPLFPMVMAELKGSMPQARQLTISGAGHVPQMSHPEKYAEIIKDFCFKTS